MDWLTRKLDTIDDHVAVLPEPLRAVLARELAAGNAVAEAGTGFPAPPVGVWVKLAKPFLTSDQPPPDGVKFRVRPQNSWPAEFVDEPRHHFVTCVPGEVKLAPQPKTVDRPAPPPRPPGPTFDREQGESRPPAPTAKDEFHAAVNAAIDGHLRLLYSPDIEAAITAVAGPAGLALVKEITGFVDSPEFWQHTSLDSGASTAEGALRKTYPFLSQAAVGRIISRAMWGWK